MNWKREDVFECFFFKFICFIGFFRAIGVYGEVQEPSVIVTRSFYMFLIFIYFQLFISILTLFSARYTP